VGEVSRGAWVSVARLRVAWISVAWISVGWVAEIGAGWRRWCTCDSPKYPGCASNRCSEGGSRPAPRCCSNGRTRSRSQYAPTQAALNRIIRVCAGREAQRRRGNHTERNSGRYRFPLGRRPNRPTDSRYNAPFLSMNPALRLCEPEGLAAVGLENSLAEPVRGDLVSR